MAVTYYGDKTMGNASVFQGNGRRVYALENGKFKEIDPNTLDPNMQIRNSMEQALKDPTLGQQAWDLGVRPDTSGSMWMGTFNNLGYKSINPATGSYYDIKQLVNQGLIDENGNIIGGKTADQIGTEQNLAAQAAEKAALQAAPQPQTAPVAGFNAQSTQIPVTPKYGDVLTLANGQKISAQDPNYSTFAKQLGISPQTAAPTTPAEATAVQQAGLGRKISNVEELNKLAALGLTENDIVRKDGSIYLKPESKFSVGGTGVQATTAPAAQNAPAATTDLKATIEQQVKQLGGVPANKDFVAGAIKAYLGRNATQSELNQFTGKTVKSVYDSVKSMVSGATNDQLLSSGKTPDQVLADFEMEIRNTDGTPKVGTPEYENLLSDSAFGSIFDAYTKALEKVNTPVVEAQNKILEQLTSMPSMAAELERIKKEEGVDQLMNQITELSKAAQPITTALKDLPTNLLSRYADIGLSSAALARRLALESKDLAGTLADITSSQSALQEDLQMRQDAVSQILEMTQIDNSQKQQILETSLGFIQQNAEQQQDLLKFQTDLAVEQVKQKMEDAQALALAEVKGDNTNTPASYDEWVLAGGEAGTGKTYAEFISSGKPATAAQQKAAGYYDRAKSANDVLTSLDDYVSSLGIAGQAMLNAPAWLQSSDGQAYAQARKQFTEAYLRRDSGAAIAGSEYANADKMYFVQPGDTPETIAQKAAARKTIMDSIAREAGGLVDSGSSDNNDPMGLGFNQPVSSGLNSSNTLSALDKYKKTQTYDTKVSYITGRDYHGGIDYAIPKGTSIPLPAGKVVAVSKDDGSGKGYGNSVTVEDQNGNRWKFAHLDSVPFKTGQVLKNSSAISGNSGYSTGPHLHLEIKDKSGKLINPYI